MADHRQLFIFLLSFGVVALASRQVGAYTTRFRLPLISGFLLSGIVAGPCVLALIDGEAVARLDFVTDIALATIAFAAGGELHVEEFRGRFRGIASVTAGLVAATFVAGTAALYLLSGSIPFLRGLPPGTRLAAAIVTGTILVARSPSSAIAIVNELRAKGPFTKLVLGVTVIMDAVVIVLFALGSEVAGALTTESGSAAGFLLLIGAELGLSLLLGLVLWKTLVAVLASRFGQAVKCGFIGAIGYGVFAITGEIRELTAAHLPFEIPVEPLLVSMLGAGLVANASVHRAELARILERMSLPICIAFFTLTGASLELDVLLRAWPVALALFGVRLASIFAGTFTGGMLAGEPARFNRVSWMAFVTQAGVGIGLAKEVAARFPAWGPELATVIVAVIVVNQLVGPPLFKWAVQLAGEAHTRAAGGGFDGVRDAVIFTDGGGEALSLARRLTAHGWVVKVAAVGPEAARTIASDVPVHPVPEVTAETLDRLDARRADAVISLLGARESFDVLELCYERYGTETMVVLLHEREWFERFGELGALVIDASTAMVSLLEHSVLSPTATSILLGLEDGQEIMEVEVRDPDLDGVRMRDLVLPHDTAVVSVRRGGHTLICHGSTTIEVGDRVTVMGPDESLEALTLLFDAYPAVVESCEERRRTQHTA